MNFKDRVRQALRQPTRMNTGGFVRDAGGGDQVVYGPTHEQGGVPRGSDVELEGGGFGPDGQPLAGEVITTVQDVNGNDQEFYMSHQNGIAQKYLQAKAQAGGTLPQDVKQDFARMNEQVSSEGQPQQIAEQGGMKRYFENGGKKSTADALYASAHTGKNMATSMAAGQSQDNPKVTHYKQYLTEFLTPFNMSEGEMNSTINHMIDKGNIYNTNKERNTEIFKYLDGISGEQGTAEQFYNARQADTEYRRTHQSERAQGGMEEYGQGGANLGMGAFDALSYMEDGGMKQYISGGMPERPVTQGNAGQWGSDFDAGPEMDQAMAMQRNRTGQHQVPLPYRGMLRQGGFNTTQLQVGDTVNGVAYKGGNQEEFIGRNKVKKYFNGGRKHYPHGGPHEEISGNSNLNNTQFKLPEYQDIPGFTSMSGDHGHRPEQQPNIIPVDENEEKGYYVTDGNGKDVWVPEGQSVLYQGKPEQSWGSKAWEIATNPFTAFGEHIRTGEVRDHFSKNENSYNPFDYVSSLVNPLAYIDAIDKLTTKIDKEGITNENKASLLLFAATKGKFKGSNKVTQKLSSLNTKVNKTKVGRTVNPTHGWKPFRTDVKVPYVGTSKQWQIGSALKTNTGNLIKKGFAYSVPPALYSGGKALINGESAAPPPNANNLDFTDLNYSVHSPETIEATEQAEETQAPNTAFPQTGEIRVYNGVSYQYIGDTSAAGPTNPDMWIVAETQQ